MELISLTLIIAAFSGFFSYHVFEVLGAMYDIWQDNKIALKAEANKVYRAANARTDKAIAWMNYSPSWELQPYAVAA